MQKKSTKAEKAAEAFTSAALIINNFNIIFSAVR